MFKPPQQSNFLKIKLSDTALLGFLFGDNPTRAERGSAASFPVTLRYIFRHYYHTDFKPTLMGDALLVAPPYFDRHMKAHDIEMIAQMYWIRGYRLGEFHDERQVILRLRNDFKRANYYVPREELLGLKGDIIDMPEQQILLNP